MRKFREIMVRLGGLFYKQRKDLELDEEIESHLQMHIDDNLQRGMTPEEARRQAMIKLGGIEFTKEAYRDQRGLPWLEMLFQDVRYGARMLRKNPGFTAVAVLTLALGIGSSTAIFSLVNAVLLRELPFPESEQIAVIWAKKDKAEIGGATGIPPTNSDVAQWREQNRSFAQIAAFTPGSVSLVDDGEPERVGAAGVTAGFFEALGVAPLLGRAITREEETPGRPPVALIGHGLWQRRFGADPSLIGKTVTMNGAQRTVIGILPPEFDFPRGAEWPASFPFAGRTEIWVPLAYRAQDDGSGWSNWQSRQERGLVVVGRLKPGTSMGQAQAEMDAFAAREARDYPGTHKDWSVKLVSLREQLVGKYQPALLILFGAVGLLMLIACVNVANLQLARAFARQQEMAVRAALGARRERLVRQLFTECLLLAVLGCGFGLLVAKGCLQTFIALNPVRHTRLDEASLDPAALGFAVLVALVTSALFGLVPALQASRYDLRKSLHEGGRSVGGSGRERMRGWLVATEVALALVLLTTAGLMIRSFLRVQSVNPGFKPDSVLAFELQAGPPALFEEITSRLEALPGVRSAGAISYLPLSGGENMGRFSIEGEAPIEPGNQPSAERRWVTPGYFATMGITVLNGRVFSANDSTNQPKVIVINETLARRFFSSRNPVGQRLKIGGPLRTIVGVVADVKSASLESEMRPQVYLPHAQDPWPSMTMVVQTEKDPQALAASIRNELKAFNSKLLVTKMRTMERVIADASGARRFNMALLAFFAGVAFLLTVIGIYGVVTFLAGRRRQEIGIRVALGAQRNAIYKLIIQQGMKPVLFGCLAGLIGSFVASRFLASQLYGISPTDPLTFAMILVSLLFVALLACWLPARRAALIDPMIVMRG